MLTFDINQPPPSHHEIAAERQRLAVEKKRLLNYALLSDAVHGGSLLLIYIANLLSGVGLLVTIFIGTALMVVLLTKRKRMARASLFSVLGIAILAAFMTGMMLFIGLNEELPGSLLVSLAMASSVISSVRIGSRLLDALDGLYGLKPLAEDEMAQQEMLKLCRRYAALEDYRQQALAVLRPQLTIAELEAMRRWAASQSQPQV